MMKIFILSMVIAACTANYYAPRFVKQLDDYKSSSACIMQTMNEYRVERNQVEPIGDTCRLKGE